MTQLATPVNTQPLVQERPLGSARFDWAVTITAVWFIFGLFLDGWAHNNISNLIEDFFTPWHAVFYSGFLAVTAVHIWHMFHSYRQGYSWRQGYPWTKLLPVGYDLSLLGIIIFATGGAGDLVWHEIFGIEEDIAALFSPSHLALIVGMALIVTGPIRAIGHRKTKQSGWAALFPVVLCATFLISLFTFITQFAYFLTEPWIATGLNSRGFTGDASQILGVLGAIIFPAMLMGILLAIMRRWDLPVGSVTFVLAVNILLMGWMRDDFIGVPAMVLTGLIGDGLLLWLKPGKERPFAFRIFAAIIPFTIFAIYMITIVTTGKTWWVVHLLTGIPTYAAATGLLLSYLVLPPDSMH
ncbi:MAG: hypothetical protein AAF614_39390 [Chloroflexota bacterium]